MIKIANRTNVVNTMREIRDKLSIEIMNMTLEQEKQFIKEQIAKLKLANNINPHYS